MLNKTGHELVKQCKICGDLQLHYSNITAFVFV